MSEHGAGIVPSRMRRLNGGAELVGGKHNPCRWSTTRAAVVSAPGRPSAALRPPKPSREWRSSIWRSGVLCP
jgi:hypothetical protein